MSHLKQIYKQLGLSDKNGLYFTEKSDWQHLFSYRVSRLIEETIQPEALFVFDNKPFILFFENIGSKELKRSKLNQIWNFNETPIVIVSNKNSVEIYNGLKFYRDEDLSTLVTEENLNDFSYFEIVTGKAWEKYSNEFNHNKRVDYLLLENIKTARKIILQQNIDKRTANSLLGKIIFTRYLIDRKIKIDFYKEGSRIWSNQEFCELLRDKDNVILFFNYLKSKFNGNLFPIEEGDLDKLPQTVFDVLSDMLLGKDLRTHQISLFELYDFSIIPVEFISNVYELFIGQQEQENEGAYYTPLFLVDYILKETVEKKLEINGKSTDCKVLDPSCGSGIFLVETLRKIIEKYRRTNPDYKKNINDYKNKLKKLALDNIFGVDKDESAINVAAFSIYLTLLDYQEPSDIETFKFPILLNKNFFVSDFFDTKSKFNETLEKHNFDFILGNPPWKRGRGEKNLPYVSYINNRRKTEKGKFENEITISNKEIAQAFTLRVSDFSNTNTQIALIVTSKILYNLNGLNYRKYFLDRFALQRVFELAPVRKEIFNKSQDKAVAPAAILFYRLAEKPTDKNILEHITLKPSRFFSMFKIFTIQRNDFKLVNQGQLKKFDFMWKVLVYGNYLDFNLIKRLKSNYLPVNKLIYTDDFIVKQGLKKTDGKKKINVSVLKGWDFLDTSGKGGNKEIQPFFISDDHKKWILDEVGYIFKNKTDEPFIDLFKPPALLITEGVDSSFRPRAAMLYHKAVYTSSITAVKGDINVLKNICAILNSNLAPYYFTQTSSYLGIEREQINDKDDKFSIPYIQSTDIIDAMEKLEVLKLQEYKNQKKLSFTESIANKVCKAEITLNKHIYNALQLSTKEESLIKYSRDILIPLIMKHKGHQKLFSPLRDNDQSFKNYAQVFFNRFNVIFERVSQKIVVEVKHTNQIVGLFFKVVDTNSKEDKITIKKSTNDSFIKLLAKLGTDKITEKLFIQKDIRGFEKDGFYLVKPNEERLWHTSLAYVDVDDFMDAILIAGKKADKNV